jgi:hypothetical protein
MEVSKNGGEKEKPTAGVRFSSQPHVLAGTHIIDSFMDTEKALNNYKILVESYKEKDIDKEDFEELQKEYFEHLKWRWKYVKSIFNQRRITTWIITGFIVLLILSGIVFTGIQLFMVVSLNNLSELNSEITIETAGKISINSSIVGAIVLIISLAFFYLYLQYVYKIQNPEPPPMRILEDKKK